MQESPPTSFQFREEQPDDGERDASQSTLRSLIVPSITGLIIALALLSIPLFMWALGSVGLPRWLGFLPVTVVALFLIVLFAVKLRNPAERTHGKHTGAKAEHPLRRRPDAPEGSGIVPFLQMLDSLLDASWVVYRDVMVPNATEPIDAVLVGSTGVYVLEHNVDSGSYRLRDGLWEWQDWHDRWRLDQKNPLMRLHRKQDDLEYFLHANRAEVRTFSRLIWAGEGKIVVPPDTDAIWFINDGGDMIWQDLHRGKILPYQTIDNICQLLAQISRSA